MNKFIRAALALDARIKQASFYLIGPLFITIALLAWANSNHHRSKAAALTKSTHVVAIGRIEAVTSGGKGQPFTQGFAYVFKDQSGRAFRGQQQLRFKNWIVGQDVPVFYALKNPSMNALDVSALGPAADSQRSLALLCLLLGVVMTALVVIKHCVSRPPSPSLAASAKRNPSAPISLGSTSSPP